MRTLGLLLLTCCGVNAAGLGGTPLSSSVSSNAIVTALGFTPANAASSNGVTNNQYLPGIPNGNGASFTNIQSTNLPSLVTAYPAALTNNDTRQIVLTNSPLLGGSVGIYGGQASPGVLPNGIYDLVITPNASADQVIFGAGGSNPDIFSIDPSNNKYFRFGIFGNYFKQFGLTVGDTTPASTLGVALYVFGKQTNSGGYASGLNNGATPTTITVGASVFNYTNTQPVNIQVFLDANGATTAVTMNGSAIFGSLVGGDHTIILQPNDRIGVTYSVATPVMKYREF